MDKKIAALLGAAAALTTMSGAQAASPAEALSANSYADLLTPVPNALSLQIADDTARAAQPAADMKLAQITVQVGHHHHHHRYHRRVIIERRGHRRHHHHHHHHHHSQYMAVPKTIG